MSDDNENIEVMGRIGGQVFFAKEGKVDGDTVTVVLPSGEEVELPYAMLEMFVARRIRRLKIRLFRNQHPREALFSNP